MAKPNPITVDEWRKELDRLQPKGADGFTRRDVEREMALGEHAAGVRLRAWVEKGHVEYAGRRPGTTIDGRPLQIPVYRIRRASKKPTR